MPFDKIVIRIITIHLQDFYQKHEDTADEYSQNVTRFLQTKSYRLVKTLQHNYIYQLNFGGGGGTGGGVVRNVPTGNYWERI